METCLVRLADERNSDVLYFPKVESLALGYIAAYMRASSFRVKIVDEEIGGFPRKDTIQKLRNASLVGFTAIAKPQILQITKTIRALRESGSSAHFSAGGQYASFLHRELLELPGVFDSVVRFEGERTFAELASAVEQGKTLGGIKGLSFKEKNRIIENPLRPLAENLDALPFPARDTLPLVIEKGGLPAISSSRGCYNRCSYCSISSFYNAPGGAPFRLRSPANVMAELKGLKESFPGLSEVWFVDDNFVAPGAGGWRRTLELCKGIKQLGLQFDIYLRANDINKKLLLQLKRSGLRNIFIGAEAANDRTLQRIFNKNITARQTLGAIRLCNRMRISVDPGFIMFHPWSTMHEIGQNIRFLEATKQFTLYGIASYLTPYTFTPIGQRMLGGELPYKKPEAVPDQRLNDFVPYEIMDKRAELLLCLTLDTFELFRGLPALFSRLKQKARKMKSEGQRKEAVFLEKKWASGVREMNKAGMRFFKRLFRFMEKAELRDSEIKPFFAGFKAKIGAYVEETKVGLNKLLAGY